MSNFEAIEIPKIDKSWRAFVQSFRQPKPVIQKIEKEPIWKSRYISLTKPEEILTLVDVGYKAEEINQYAGKKDDTLYLSKFRFLNEEGIEKLLAVTNQLEKLVVPSSYIVGHWLRGVEKYSQFICDMMRDRKFLKELSQMVGVSLISHPIQDAAVVLNKLIASPKKLDNKDNLAAWHLDGMNYVFIILLSEPRMFEGGELIYYRKHKNLFPNRVSSSDRAIHTINLEKPGDTIFMRGSHLYHAVRPLISGERKTLILSFFCPPLAEFDSNTFWHLAPADGLIPTLENWIKFKWSFH